MSLLMATNEFNVVRDTILAEKVVADSGRYPQQLWTNGTGIPYLWPATYQASFDLTPNDRSTSYSDLGVNIVALLHNVYAVHEYPGGVVIIGRCNIAGVTYEKRHHEQDLDYDGPPTGHESQDWTPVDLNPPE